MPRFFASVFVLPLFWNIISNWSSANKQCFEVELAGPKDQERVFRVASKNVIAYRGEKTVVDFVDITDC